MKFKVGDMGKPKSNNECFIVDKILRKKYYVTFDDNTKHEYNIEFLDNECDLVTPLHRILHYEI